MTRASIHKKNNFLQVACNPLILRYILQIYYCYPSALFIQRGALYTFP